jgi:alpha-L-fucosidase
LLNVGPTAEGLIPEPSVQRLLAMGAWLHDNGEAVYGTRPGPIQGVPWCRSTAKAGRLYLHVLDWPRGGMIAIPGLQQQVSRAHLLADPQAALSLSRQGDDLLVRAPASAPDAVDTVLVLEVL